MALAIATNTGALMAAAAASSVNKDMETSMERLSTGKRINSAADDAAGVAIASRLSSEIRGTNQAIRNSMDAQGLIDTAEGAHKEVENILQRMRELSVQAANDSNGTSDRTALQAEMTQLTEEIDRIAATTTWAGISLLNGGASAGTVNTTADTARTFNFQIATNTDGTGDTLAVSIKDIGSLSLGLSGSATATISSTETDPTTTYPGVSHNTITTAGAFALAIDASNGQVTVTPPGTVPTASGSEAVTITVDGTAVAIDLFTDGVQLGYDVSTAGGTAAAINNKLSQDSTLAAAGVDFAYTNGNAYFTASKAGASTIDTSTANQIGVSDWTAGETITLTIDGNDVAVTTSASDGYEDTQAGLVQQLTEAINNAGISGITATANTANNRVDIAKSTSVSVASNSDAQTAIGNIDDAISELNTQRASLGAYSNRLDNTVSNLTNIAINLEGGRGRIEDADFAAESTSLAKSQILQQASTAMLAQANASKQNVLSLLQG
jgi:flagellin